MKILVVCQHYYPEPFRITDICEELVKMGHTVSVVTGLPNYPMGTLYQGYESRAKRREEINGVDVHRCFTIPRKTGVIRRVLNYFSFAISSSRYVRKLDADYDVVFVNQLSPVMMANSGVKYKKKHGTRLVLYCLDLWPESLTVGGIKKGSVAYKIFHKVSRKIYSSADRLLITSKSFAKYFEKEFGINNTEYLPQYAEALFDPETCKKEENGYIDLMFAGNVGAAQSVDTIIRAAKLTEDIPNLRWHIVGEGSELNNCRALAEDLSAKSVIFHGRHPIEEMPRFYAMADAMLVTMQKNPIVSLTLPGKVQTYMAAGKPIIGAIDGETALVIDEAKCGLCAPAEDHEALANAARCFVSCTNADYAKNSLNYYGIKFVKNEFFESLLKVFEG